MFKTTPNKDFIRENIDKKQVAYIFNEKKRKLKYIGLPGEELLDIKSWKDYLDKIYAIECGEFIQPEIIPNRMYLNALKLDLLDRFSILEGGIDSILISGKDKHNNKLDYPFDLANFDYCGSILYEGFKRIESIKAFIKNQEGTSFLLLYSSRLKEKEETEKIKAINNIKLEILATHEQPEEYQKINGFFNILCNDARCKVQREKIFNLYFIKNYAESIGYTVNFLKPIMYEGFNKHILIRFISRFTYCGKTTTKVISKQGLLDIINLDTSILKNNKLTKMDNPLGKLNL